MKPTAIVLPSTGLKLERVKRKERPLVPPALLRLYKMLDCAIQPLPQPGELEDLCDQLVCQFCQDRNRDDSGPAVICPICLWAHHAACVEKFICGPLQKEIEKAVANSSSSSSSNAREMTDTDTHIDLSKLELGLMFPELLQTTSRQDGAGGCVLEGPNLNLEYSI